jgi:eukaryotic-like serine/threonine-protein kinase
MAAWDEAAVHAERALEMLALEQHDGTQAKLLAALLAAANAHTYAGELERGRKRYDEAAAVARRAGDDAAFARAALGFAEWAEYGVVDEPAIALLNEALERLERGDSALRATLMGRLAVRLDPAGSQERREQILDDAIAMARRLGDDGALAPLLGLSPLVNWRPERADVRAAAAAESIATAGSAGDRQGALWARMVRVTDAFAAGDMHAVDAELYAYDALAGELRLPYYRWYGLVMRATQSAFGGELDAAERLVEEAYALIRQHEDDVEQEHTVQRLMLALMRGRPHEADSGRLHELAEQHAALPMWAALAARLDAELGRNESAERVLGRLGRHDFAAIADSPDRLGTLVALAETCARVRDVRRAARLYELLLPYADANVLTDRAWAAWGAAARSLGQLAALQGRTEAAAAHFERAAELERAWGARPWLAHTLVATAVAAGDHAAAPALAEARELCAELDLPGLLGRVTALESTGV